MRKTMGLFLSLMFSLSILLPAYAVEYDEIEYQYDRHTITLSPITPQINITFDNIPSENDAREQNFRNYELAKEYVLSLGLPEKGLKHIEDSCLSELDALMQDNFVLTSYTVLTPKTRASYSFYGTYNNVDFYSSYYSTRTGYSEKKKTSTKSTLVDWISGSTALTLGIAGGNKFSIPFSLIQMAAGSVGTITYHDGASVEYKCAIEATSLGVYSKSGSNYKLCYSTEKGTAAPYIVYNTASTIKPVITKDDFPRQNIKAPSYDNKQVHLASAWAVYKEGTSPVKMRVDSSIDWSFAKK